MAFTQNFTISQTPANPAFVIVTDTSIGDPLTNGIASRRITITDCNGNYLVPTGTTTNYIDWSLPNNPISLDLLTQDMALNVLVQWLDSNGVVVVQLDNNYCLSEFNKQFLYYLIQLQSHNYNIIQDTNYWGNVGIFWSNIIGAINSVEIGDDIFASQTCLNRATNMAQNQAFYF
tara:strand:- start:2022 stop:2546 length:525 start_codon:yes stop_codon:yes gene_type:complete